MTNNNWIKFIISFDFPSNLHLDRFLLSFRYLPIQLLIFYPCEDFAKLSFHIHALLYKLCFFRKTFSFSKNLFSTSFTGAFELSNVLHDFRKRQSKILYCNNMCDHCKLWTGVWRKISILNYFERKETQCVVTELKSVESSFHYIISSKWLHWAEAWRYSTRKSSLYRETSL